MDAMDAEDTGAKYGNIWAQHNAGTASAYHAGRMFERALLDGVVTARLRDAFLDGFHQGVRAFRTHDLEAV